jgi:hypothetical protein
MAHTSQAIDGFASSVLNSSGARYIIVPVCGDGVVIPLSFSGMNIRDKPKSQILGFSLSSMRILFCGW